MPALDISALRSQIKAGKLAPLYLLVGEDGKLIDRMVDAIEGTVDAADRPFAVERLYAGDQGGLPLDIAAAARVYPMLGDRRIVFVLRAERLLKPKRAARATEADEAGPEPDGADASTDLTPLEDYLAGPVPSTTLVFVASDVDKGRRFTKRVLEKAHVVSFDGIGGMTAPERREGRAEAVSLVKAELAREGRTIDPAALNVLIERSGGDVTRLRSNLERLLLFTTGRAGMALDDIEATVPDESAADPFAMINAIAEGDAARALREAALRLERGDSPHGMVGQLRWWVSTRLADGAPGRVGPALELLMRTDLALKSSGGDDRVLMERLVVELTGEALPRRNWP